MHDFFWKLLLMVFLYIANSLGIVKNEKKKKRDTRAKAGSIYIFLK